MPGNVRDRRGGDGLTEYHYCLNQRVRGSTSGRDYDDRLQRQDTSSGPPAPVWHLPPKSVQSSKAHRPRLRPRLNRLPVLARS